MTTHICKRTSLRFFPKTPSSSTRISHWSNAVMKQKAKRKERENEMSWSYWPALIYEIFIAFSIPPWLFWKPRVSWSRRSAHLMIEVKSSGDNDIVVEEAPQTACIWLICTTAISIACRRLLEPASKGEESWYVGDECGEEFLHRTPRVAVNLGSATSPDGETDERNDD